ncbi:hypothetical protein PENTCL1PPCAC_28153, partial [Pristionchus entomophagus]
HSSNLSILAHSLVDRMNCPRQLTRICRICTAQADSAHFGVDACRACAAFFKRTVQLAKKYICRQSTGNCNVGKEVRHTCRRCRYAKCLAVGMKPESVPTAANYVVRDPDWNEKKSPESLYFEARSPQSDLLENITEQYRSLEQLAMRSDEHLMTEAFGDRLQRKNGHIPSTIGLLNQCMRGCHQPTIHFITNCFPEIANFNEEEKWLVIKNFVTSRFIFDGVHKAQKYFPGNEKIFMVTFHTFVDFDNIEFYLSDMDDIYDKNDAVRIIREAIKCTSDWLEPLLTNAVIDETEQMAIYGLLCWPSYLSNASPRVMEVCYQYHLRIFQELQDHYRRTGVSEYSSRVSNITSMLLCVQAAIQRLKEDMQIYRLLDVHNEHELVYNVVQ